VTQVAVLLGFCKVTSIPREVVRGRAPIHMKKRIRFPSVVLGLLFLSVASAQTTFVAGPVEKISPDSRQITVLGQTYLIDTQTVFSSGATKLRGQNGIRVLTPGTLVSIESRASQSATLVTVSARSYVSGATTVFVSGKVEQLASELGLIKVGGLSIDVSAVQPEALASLQTGSLVEVSGKQPLPQGLLLAEGIVVAAPASAKTTDSIGGTGKTVSLDSIGGTGSNASLQSIGGTGKTASLQSIGGTGKSVSLQSIGGTGSNVSLQSIGGTGKGASLQSIGGTGKSASLESIGGTGTNASLQSIGGTGKTVLLNSIGGTGTGASVQSIGGTGALAQ
jgi:uncharacterized protein DUF5666